jgi:hypothetical protein
MRSGGMPSCASSVIRAYALDHVRRDRTLRGDLKRQTEAPGSIYALDVPMPDGPLGTDHGHLALGFWQAIEEVAHDPRPALLGAQDCQCAEQAAEEPAICQRRNKNVSACRGKNASRA